MKQNEQKPCPCGCSNPFSSLPPEMQPRVEKATKLIQATCPECGREFWTNVEPGLCFDCRKKAPRAVG